MNRKIEFGVRIPNSGPLASPANLIRAATEAEALGYDSIWVHDHLAWSPEMHRHHISSGAAEALAHDQTPDFYESLITLSHLAALTRKVRLGVACIVLPCRHPVHIAKQLAVLDVMSGGRIDVGVGLGSLASAASREYEAAGVPKNGRARRLDEYVAVLRAVWQHGPVSYHGEFVFLDGVHIDPKPLQRPGPPIWIGGGTPPAARRAGRLGDGWIPGWLTPQELKEHLVVMAEEAGKCGRPADIPVGLEVIACIARDRATAMRQARPTIATSLKTYERSMDSDDFAVEQSIIGSIEDVRRQVAGFIAAGVTHFELKFVYSTMDELSEQMELWTNEILPAYQ